MAGSIVSHAFVRAGARVTMWRTAMTRHAPTPLEVKRLLDNGVPESSIVHLLVETGYWTMDGAESIVASLSGAPDFVAHAAAVPIPERRLALR
jgi:hypothetical protein